MQYYTYVTYRPVTLTLFFVTGMMNPYKRWGNNAPRDQKGGNVPMKNLKKVLAMVLAFACTFTMFAGAKVFEDVPAEIGRAHV